MKMRTSEVLLVIADISGYTRFMVANETELEHGHTIIATLLEEIISEAVVPLALAKIEGDAVFFYADKDDVGDEAVRDVGLRLPRFFSRFATKLRALTTSLTCGCRACVNVDKLRLKMIVHRGKALVYEIAGQTELAGVDVIVAHRLLKNSIDSREYLLLTDPARDELSPDLDVLETSIEEIDEIGPVRVTAYQPQARVGD